MPTEARSAGEQRSDASEGAAPTPAYSIVVPVYGSEGSLSPLRDRIAGLMARLDAPLEVVFVVDGSPDRSADVLAELLPEQPFASRLALHSRNFGSFAAIRTGMQRTRGRYVGVMAADLQEPAELMLDFFAELRRGTSDLVVGLAASIALALVVVVARLSGAIVAAGVAIGADAVVREGAVVTRSVPRATVTITAFGAYQSLLRVQGRLLAGLLALGVRRGGARNRRSSFALACLWSSASARLS